MKQLFKLQLGIIFFIFTWACVPDTELPELSNAGQQDVIPLAKAFFETEKPDQKSLHARLNQDLEVYPKWEEAKTYGEGEMLIVPAYRNVRATYAEGYLRRFVFELDPSGNVTRGGILELAGNTTNFLLENEETLISGYLNGIKSSALTYVWSDFGFSSIEAVQADGKVVTRSVDRLLNAKRGTESFSMMNCIDWYWVYSVVGVVVYEEFSHTTCMEASCDENTELACLDDGLGGPNDGVGDEYIFIDDPEAILNNIENKYGNLNGCEKEVIRKSIFDGDIDNIYAIFENSILANDLTTFLFGQNGGGNNLNDCGDAFRHAYWNALNVMTTGDNELSKSFANAHECETPPERELEKNMDLINNEVGRNIGLIANESNLFNLVLTALYDGDLVVLNQLDQNNGIILGVSEVVTSFNRCN